MYVCTTSSHEGVRSGRWPTRDRPMRRRGRPPAHARDVLHGARRLRKSAPTGARGQNRDRSAECFACRSSSRRVCGAQIPRARLRRAQSKPRAWSSQRRRVQRRPPPPPPGRARRRVRLNVGEPRAIAHRALDTPVAAVAAPPLRRRRRRGGGAVVAADGGRAADGAACASGSTCARSVGASWRRRGRRRRGAGASTRSRQRRRRPRGRDARARRRRTVGGARARGARVPVLGRLVDRGGGAQFHTRTGVFSLAAHPPAAVRGVAAWVAAADGPPSAPPPRRCHRRRAVVAAAPRPLSPDRSALRPALDAIGSALDARTRRPISPRARARLGPLGERPSRTPLARRNSAQFGGAIRRKLSPKIHRRPIHPHPHLAGTLWPSSTPCPSGRALGLPAGCDAGLFEPC